MVIRSLLKYLTRATASSPLEPSNLVYDADSDLVVAIDSGRAYDTDTDTWIEVADPPSDAGRLHSVYDPVTGLIVTRDSETAVMWAFDVDTDTWTQVDQGSFAPAPGPSARGSMVYDPATDRILHYYADNSFGGGPWDGVGIQATWSFDPRAGKWEVEPTATPELRGPRLAVYDESAQLSVFVDDGFVMGYDATTQQWQGLWQAERLVDGHSTGPHSGWPSWIVYDPINERVVVGNGYSRTGEDDDYWVESDDIWGFDARAGTWIELLPSTQ